jgi:hypothetical protein
VLITLLSCTAAAVAAWLAYYLIGSEVDNVLGILRRRDLGLFLAHDLSGLPLGRVVEARVGACNWFALHDELIPARR